MPVMLSLRSRAAASLAVAAVIGCQGKQPAPPIQEESTLAVDRGKYLVSILACNDCHTPFHLGPRGPEPDMSRMLSGHPADLVMPPAPQLPPGPWLWTGAATNTAYAGPWGVSYATNLTPHELTGIGIWTEEIFVKTLKTGQHWGVSRPILPPMPWPSYSHMTDADLKAIFAYLRTIPALDNRVPDAIIAAAPPAAAP